MNISVHCIRVRDNIDISEVNCKVLNRKSLNNFEENTGGNFKSIINYKLIINLLCAFLLHTLYISIQIFWLIFFLHKLAFTNVAILAISLHPRVSKGEASTSAWSTIAHGSLSLSFIQHLSSSLLRLSHRHKVSQAHGTRFAATTLHSALFLHPSLPNALAVRHPRLSYRSSIPPRPVVRPSVSPLRVTLSSVAAPRQLSSRFPAIVRMSWNARKDVPG